MHERGVMDWKRDGVQSGFLRRVNMVWTMYLSHLRGMLSRCTVRGGVWSQLRGKEQYLDIISHTYRVASNASYIYYFCTIIPHLLHGSTCVAKPAHSQTSHSTPTTFFAIL